MFAAQGKKIILAASRSYFLSPQSVITDFSFFIEYHTTLQEPIENKIFLKLNFLADGRECFKYQ